MPNPLRRHTPVAALGLVLVLAAAACSPGGTSPATSSPGAAAESMGAESMAPESMAPESMAPADSPAPSSVSPGASASPESPAAEPTPGPAAAALAGRAWATEELTDVTTGETFRIADLAGKTIFVESMAIWCTNCRQQQARFAEALAQLDPESVAYVVVTVDPSESAEDLARYKADRGFTGLYAVAGTALAKALVDEFGPNAINPPSVPLVHVTPDGEVSFGTGGESVDEIVALARG